MRRSPATRLAFEYAQREVARGPCDGWRRRAPAPATGARTRSLRWWITPQPRARRRARPPQASRTRPRTNVRLALASHPSPHCHCHRPCPVLFRCIRLIGSPNPPRSQTLSYRDGYRFKSQRRVCTPAADPVGFSACKSRDSRKKYTRNKNEKVTRGAGGSRSAH